MKWGAAKTYAWLHSISGQQYQNQLMAWLEWENPELHAVVLKELAHGEAKSRKGKHQDLLSVEGDAP